MPTALVTGGNKGIGKAVAHVLAIQGYKVWIGARDEARGIEAQDKLRAEGLDVSFVLLDVKDRASIEFAFNKISAETGSLDVLVNNAGISLESPGGFGQPIAPSQVPEAMLREIYDVNFFAPVVIIQIFLPLLLAASAGRIVNVSSALGSMTLTTSPNPPYRVNAMAYTSSKSALNMATVQLAYELRDTPIKINAANPGFIATDLSGPGNSQLLAGRPGVGTPDDGARIIVKLATLPADGPSGGLFDYDHGVLPW